MAVQGSGTVARANNPDPAMVDQQKYDARSGAPKRTQTTSPIKWGMKDQTQYSRVGPGMAPSGEPNPAYHFGPDASSANPSDPETPAERGKTLRRQPGTIINGDGTYQPGNLTSSWGMKDANGRGVDNAVGKAVLDEAILSGGKLPATTAEQTGAGPAYTGNDPN